MEAFGQSADQNCKINRRIYTDTLGWQGSQIMSTYVFLLYVCSLRINMSIWKHSGWKN